MGRRPLIIDSSALVAVMLDEPEADDLAARIDAAENPATTVVNAFEAMMSLGRALEDRSSAASLVPEFLGRARIQMVGVGAELYDDLVAAYMRYGKGTGHPAKLNFGDCFSYAMAKREGVPLLYKGDDFSKTDLA